MRASRKASVMTEGSWTRISAASRSSSRVSGKRQQISVSRLARAGAPMAPVVITLVMRGLSMASPSARLAESE